LASSALLEKKKHFQILPTIFTFWQPPFPFGAKELTLWPMDLVGKQIVYFLNFRTLVK